LDEEKTVVRYNGEWLSKLTLVDLIRLGQNFTIQQFLARENFAKRMDEGEPIYLHETFYPLMQGYDAVAMETDVQIGGTDQLFNIMMGGRKLQEAKGQQPLIGIICGILPGTDGVQRMSKSTGNIVPINTTPEDMYGKVMSIPDDAMEKYYRLVTRFTPAEIDTLLGELAAGTKHPRDVKMTLAREIVDIFYGSDAVEPAEKAFVALFQKKAVPDDMPEYELQAEQTVLDVLTDSSLVDSRSSGKRMVKQNAVRLDGEQLKDAFAPFPNPGVLQVGKRKFVRVK
jgi:tyrosyl-tRNA synthetase